ncbi:hypothetical protein [Streptosporangium sp. NPDC048865]|uniref:hypothetical protein n=1 Tax=Streptosporangium sp. NPDC048865 TaxID=3155766 RepID=UPI00341B45A1
MTIDHTLLDAVLADAAESEDERHDCRRDGCSYEVISSHQDGPTQIVCSGTCGRSWPVGPAAPAEQVVGYLAVKASGTNDVIWSAPSVRATQQEAEGDREFWQQSHTTMNRGLTLGIAKVVLLTPKA